MFSGGRERVHWERMVYVLVLILVLVVLVTCAWKGAAREWVEKNSA